MATIFEIYCADVPKEYAQQASMRAFEIADRLELELSRFVEGSDISRINALARGASAQVGLWTMSCLQIASWAHRATHGAFDVAIGTGIEHLELIPEEHAVRAHMEGIRLDLGGIGKGYAVDRMAASLKEWDIHCALIHAGYSSVLTLAAPPDTSGWPLTLSDPAGHCVLARISAKKRALSGSGIRKRDHVVDPATGRPVRLRLAAWVSGSSVTIGKMGGTSGWAPDLTSGTSPAAIADALSTAFMILSEQEIQEFCRTYPDLEVWILGADLSMAGSSRFRHFPLAEP
jgi:thiamine biosynthesis lipoprotein